MTGSLSNKIFLLFTLIFGVFVLIGMFNLFGIQEGMEAGSNTNVGTPATLVTSYPF